MKNLFLLGTVALIGAAVSGCTCCGDETIAPCASPRVEGPALVYEGVRPPHHKHHRHHAHHPKHHKHHAHKHPAHKAAPKGDGTAPGGGS
ncbi:MAG TPA: hypothetical protein VMW10_02845 [Alphaproteobacteria bacterium]|nr:hypothetical protein [Alphaproteobacteria bacterium]